MLTRLKLKNFKSFREADLPLGPLTVLVGANASGKSNLRDAFRFLHGIGRGYSLAEIIGEKWGEGGVLQWRGIRGGTREITYGGEDRFGVEVELAYTASRKATYGISVDISSREYGPLVIDEYLLNSDGDDEIIVFDSRLRPQHADLHFVSEIYASSHHQRKTLPFGRQQPILSRLGGRLDVSADAKKFALSAMNLLGDMRFIDLNPEAMRRPSFPGQGILGDQGENLSSILLSMKEDDKEYQTPVRWIQELTPMDVKDFSFSTDASGRVLVNLVEANGQEVSANSASDGTLRFLALIAALLGPRSAAFYFFEEVDTGLHPSRLHLLLELIEQQAARRSIQVVATTHSPQMLRLLSPESLEHAALTYRLPGQAETRLTRILDIPQAREVIHDHDLARLHESGWLENVVAFTESVETAP
jgi:predicted ATPase